MREAEKFRAFAKSGVEDVVRSIIKMSDNYIWTMKDLKRNMIEDQEFIIDFDETSKDDLQWVEDSIFGVLSNLPYLKVIESKL